jgi:prolipoprotein diacylglyceryltransferase
VDLGDGTGRHPVQVYESLAMAVFLGVYWHALVRERSCATHQGFHAFVLFYAVQRFAWEFLKPYRQKPSFSGRPTGIAERHRLGRKRSGSFCTPAGKAAAGT